MAIAEASAQSFARDRRWPNGYMPMFGMLSEIRKSLLHGGHCVADHTPSVRRLFSSNSLEDLGHEVGFASVVILPLDPDVAGFQTISRMLRETGASAEFIEEVGLLAATLGLPYFSLLDRRDRSALSVAWFTKAAGPLMQRFTDPPVRPPIAHVTADAAVPSAMPRWSIELRAWNTENGVVVNVGGWCLANIDALWVRLKLGSLERHTAIYHARPDVHEVLKRRHTYHTMHAICSCVTAELLFADVHPGAEGYPLSLEIILAGGLIVDQPTVSAC